MESSERDCCKGDCEKLMKERMNYFTGRHLAARDFQDEQEHHRTHRFLHNRMLHGWGVVCGLEVREHKQPDCRDRYVAVSPGMAIDCCGREIVVDCAICCGDEQPEIPWKDYSDSRPWLVLCLAYQDVGRNPVPVLSSEGDCSTAKTETKYGRYKESWTLSWHWVAKSDLEKYGWKAQYAVCPPTDDGQDDRYATTSEAEPQSELTQSSAQDYAQTANNAQQSEREAHYQGSPEEGEHQHHPQLYPPGECPHDDCGDPCEAGFRSCLALRCPPKHCVPLALFCVEPGKPVTNDRIIMSGRPEVPHGPQRLTHIVDINWPHGGVIPSSWFERHRGLVVTFDRKLRRDAGGYYPGPSGVNQATFVVEYGGGAGFEDLDFVPYKSPPKLVDEKLKAIYRVKPEGRRYGFRFLENHVIWITLKCDFLFDCHGVRVDGNNNGIAGGTFESWVYVVSDSDYERASREGEYDRSGGQDQDDDDDHEDQSGEEEEGFESPRSMSESQQQRRENERLRREERR